MRDRAFPLRMVGPNAQYCVPLQPEPSAWRWSAANSINLLVLATRGKLTAPWRSHSPT